MSVGAFTIGSININGDASLNGRLSVGLDASFGGNLYVAKTLTYGGDVSANNRLFVGGDASFSGNLYVGKDLTINGRLNVNQYTASTVITTTTTNYTLFIAEDLSLNGRLYVTGDMSVNGNLYVVKDTSMNSRLYVGNDTSLNGNVYCSSLTTLNPINMSYTSLPSLISSQIGYNTTSTTGGNLQLTSTLQTAASTVLPASGVWLLTGQYNVFFNAAATVTCLSGCIVATTSTGTNNNANFSIYSQSFAINNIYSTQINYLATTTGSTTYYLNINGTVSTGSAPYINYGSQPVCSLNATRIA